MPNPGFRTTRFTEGYARDDVDRFVRRLDDIEAGRLPGPPDLIGFMTRVTFRPTFFGGGYQMADVDDHIDRLIEAARVRGPSTAAGQPLTELQVQTLRSVIRQTAAAPRGSRLPRTGRLVQGYRVEEVDALIERLDAAGAGRRHGYEMSDVQAWLDDVRPLFNADPSGR
jgi:DivIVA domain-containing protein